MIYKKVANKESPMEIVKKVEKVLDEDAEVASLFFLFNTGVLGLRDETLENDHIRVAQSQVEYLVIFCEIKKIWKMKKTRINFSNVFRFLTKRSFILFDFFSFQEKTY